MAVLTRDRRKRLRSLRIAAEIGPKVVNDRMKKVTHPRCDSFTTQTARTGSGVRLMNENAAQGPAVPGWLSL